MPPISPDRPISPISGSSSPSRAVELAALHQTHSALLDQKDREKAQRDDNVIGTPAAPQQPKQAIVHPHRGIRQWAFLRGIFQRSGVRHGAFTHDDHPGGFLPQAMHDKHIDPIPPESEVKLDTSPAHMKRLGSTMFDEIPAAPYQQSSLEPGDIADGQISRSLARQQRARLLAWLNRTLANLPLLR